METDASAYHDDGTAAKESEVVTSRLRFTPCNMCVSGTERGRLKEKRAFGSKYHISNPSMSLPDLEDYVPDEARAVRRDVVPAVRVRKGRTDEQDVSSYSGPGSQSVWVRTWGCGHNSSDAEYMMGQLSAYGMKDTQVVCFYHVFKTCGQFTGYTLVEDPAAADLWLLNSCTVKNPSEESLRNELER